QIQQQSRRGGVVVVMVRGFDAIVMTDREKPVGGFKMGRIDRLANLDSELEPQAADRAHLVLRLRSRLPGDDVDAGRQMRRANRIACLVALLPAGPGTAKRLNPRLRQQLLIGVKARRLAGRKISLIKRSFHYRWATRIYLCSRANHTNLISVRAPRQSKRREGRNMFRRYRGLPIALIGASLFTIHQTTLGQLVPAGVLVGPDAGTQSEIRGYTATAGSLLFSLAPYGSPFAPGIRVASGDINGDGLPDFASVPGPGSAFPLLPIGNINSTGLAPFVPYGSGGTYVAIGDVNHDTKGDIVTG